MSFQLASQLSVGSVVRWSEDRLALAVYVGPCDTLPTRHQRQYPGGDSLLGLEASRPYPGPYAEDYIEPQLVLLTHQRDDRWLMTHEVTYTLYHRGRLLKLFDSVRVQYPGRHGKFWRGDELRKVVSGELNQVHNPDSDIT